MKLNKLLIIARFSPEVIERILRVIRYRKFLIYSLNVKLNKNNENIMINLSVISNLYSIDLLRINLSKLIDIISIN